MTMRKLKRNGQEKIPPYVLAFKLELDSWLLTTHYNAAFRSSILPTILQSL